jgi:hypothetical protein
MIEGDIVCGKGPSLAYAPAIHNKLLAVVEEVAAKKKIACAMAGTQPQHRHRHRFICIQ